MAEPMDTSGPPVGIMDPNNCNQGVSSIPNPSHNVQTDAAQGPSQGFQHNPNNHFPQSVGIINAGISQTQDPNQYDTYNRNPNMQNLAYQSAQSPQMPNQAFQFGQSSQIPNQGYSAGHNPNMPNQGYSAGHNPNMPNQGYSAGHNPNMPNQGYSAGHNPNIPNQGYSAGHNPNMPNQGYSAGHSQLMLNQGYSPGHSQPMPNQGNSAGHNQPMLNQGYSPGHSQPMPNQGNSAGHNQPMLNQGYSAGHSQPMPNQGISPSDNPQMRNQGFSGNQDALMQNPGFSGCYNQNMQNSPYPSGLDQQVQNPGLANWKTQQTHQGYLTTGTHAQVSQDQAASAEIQPAFNNSQTQSQVLPTGSRDESYQKNDQSQPRVSSTGHQASSSETNVDVDALLKEVAAENFGEELKERGYCKKMLSFHELPVGLNEDTLVNYVEVCGDCEVKKLEFSLDQTAALVTVDAEPDWGKLSKMTQTRRLENKRVKFERLPLSSSVCVMFCDSNEKDMWKFYECLTPKPKDMSTRGQKADTFHVLTFSSPDDVEAVLRNKDQLTMEYNMLMSIYFENIGPVQEKSEMVIEAEVELTLGQSCLLLATRKLDEMRKHVDIDMRNQRRIMMKGKLKPVSDGKVVLQDFKSQYKEMIVGCSEGKRKYLLDETCEKLMLRRMNKKNIEGAWYQSGKQLMICATSESDLKNIANWIERHLKEKIVDVSREGYNQALKVMRRMEDGSFFLEYGSYFRELVLVTQHEEFHEACQIVDDIVEKEVKEEEKSRAQRKPGRTREQLQEPIKEILPKDHKLFLQRFQQKDLKALETRFKVSISLEGNEKEVTISGSGIQDALQGFKTIVGDLKTGILALSPEDSNTILSSGYLGCLEKYVGDTERCVINHKTQAVANESRDETLEGAVGGATGDHSSGHSSWFGSSGNYRGRRSSGISSQHTSPRRRRRDRTFLKQIKFTVEEGEIAKERSDIIVNTVTKGCDMNVGAISKSLASAGGYWFEKEFKDKQHKLHEGGYVVTGNGYLNCKQVFHCCLHPSRSPKAAESFQDVMSEMLKYADTLGSKTISFPALGTGGLGYSPECAANIMFNSVTEYSKKNKSIEEVRIVIYKNTKALKAFRDIEEDVSPKSDFSDDGKHFQGGKNTIAEVKVAEIAKEKVDIIVNTTNSSLNLGHGAVSKSLLKQAGSKLQEECDKVIKKKTCLLIWEFDYTKPGNLDCKRVYHCYMPSYPGSTYKLKNMVLEILETAHKFKNESIAFPALGTGNLGYPREEVANALFEAVKDFKKRYPSSTLKDVRFVIYPQDEKSIQAFKEAERAVSGGKSGERSSGSYTPSTTPVAPPRTKRLRVGSIQVVMKQGDLSKESLEAVVNPIDAHTSFKSNLYQALLKVGGTEFEKDTTICKDNLRRKGIASVQMKNDVMVVHIDRNEVRRDQRQAIVKCLEYADSKDYKTIGFPIMKTGEAAEGMASDMFEAIRQFNNQQKDTIIREVFVVIHKQDQFHKFSDCLKRKCESQPALMTELQTEKEQITFTITFDELSLFLNAKKVLSEFCRDSPVVAKLPLPPSVTATHITAVGTKNYNVNIKDISRSGKKILRMEGKPYNVLKAIDDFHRQFKKDFEDWDPEEVTEQFDEPGFDANDQAGSLHTLQFPKEKKSLGSSGTSYESETSMNNSFNEKFETSSHGSSINFQGQNISDTDEESKVSGSLTMDKREERSTEKRPTPYEMQWYYMDPEDDDLKEYDDDVSQKIEESYVKLKKEHKLPMDDNFEQYVVDFGAMEEYPEKNREDSVMVVRREVVPETPVQSLPKFWYPMDGKQFKVQITSSSDKEYEKILRTIEESVGRRQVTVIKIEQIQNVKTHQRFEEKKLMIARRGDSDAEKELWFKCSKTDTIVPINNWGLSVTFIKDKHYSPLGEGVEFAQSFTDVVQRDNKDNQYAYLCNVLVGDYTKVERAIRDPPIKMADESCFYTSVVDNVTKPSRFLVFSDAQIEPLFLVTFKQQT